ncbi:lipase family alpha/beta hydrolase [Nocardioides terrisoli]|uniref:lipase family alpha/beta hydrolase n=1 Tax=Nocardioides terrisoli TaxID=3388267 RepID=UPI00287B613E|nr:hypothetical protein [Nocardioides marmorisolisilvae]
MPATAGVLGAAALAAEVADDLVVGTVRDVHRAISRRVHAPMRAMSRHASVEERLHDGIATTVYAGLDLGLRQGARALRAADRPGVGPRLEEGPAGRFLLAAVNGLIGDRLRDEVPELFFDIGVRVGGRDVPVNPTDLEAAFPDHTDALVVFVHGLCENEEAWQRRRRPHNDVTPDEPAPPSYGEALAGRGWTPVHLRINTGLSLSENGVEVAALLGDLVAAWPGGVRRLVLVGHSLGGLVLRAACAVQTSGSWTSLVTDVVTLGSPHLGAPLERVVARGTGLMERLPEIAPYSRILEQRSVGILDLRHGLPPDVESLPHARYHLVAGSVSRSPRHPVALAIGDLLVQPRSALGLPRSGPEMFPGADLLHVPGADHFDLLNHDDVHAALREWLAPHPMAPDPAQEAGQ